MGNRVSTSLPCTQMTVGPEWNGTEGNWDKNRVYPINMIVIHTMDGTIQSADARFNNPASGVSAHYGIGLNGRLVQWCDETNVAYHCGDYKYNEDSIGIEHEDGGDYNSPRPDDLYATSSKLVADICKFYSIPCDRDHIKKHSEVDDNPTSCPDSLDVDRIVAGAQAILNPPIQTSTSNQGVDDVTRAISVLQDAKIKYSFGNLEGTARACVGAYVDSLNKPASQPGTPAPVTPSAPSIALIPTKALFQELLNRILGK